MLRRVHVRGFAVHTSMLSRYRHCPSSTNTLLVRDQVAA